MYRLYVSSTARKISPSEKTWQKRVSMVEADSWEYREAHWEMVHVFKMEITHVVLVFKLAVSTMSMLR